jgi:predicted metal-dependent enzyme (double-stranded beta helix superfamily)
MTETFDSFATAVENLIRTSTDERGCVLAVRAALTEALRSESFVLDCVDRVTSAIGAQGSAWRNIPIYTDRHLDYSIRVIYWPARYQNSPHEHLSWTVTGVVHNRFEVNLYRREGPPGASRLIIDRTILGAPGEVGYIIPPCIHSFANPTDSRSVSVHVFNGLSTHDEIGEKNDQTTSHAVWYSSPEKHAIIRGMRRHALLSHVEILSHMSSKRALRLLKETFRLGSAEVRFACVKAISTKDPRLAAVLLAELAAASEEPAQSDLARLSERLLAAIEG